MLLSQEHLPHLAADIGWPQGLVVQGEVALSCVALLARNALNVFPAHSFGRRTGQLQLTKEMVMLPIARQGSACLESHHCFAHKSARP